MKDANYCNCSITQTVMCVGVLEDQEVLALVVTSICK